MSPEGVCVVIPHRRHRHLLDAALGAVAGWPVVVVDDTDEGVGPLPARVERLGGGQGFARAANAGLARAAREGFGWAILLNDDATPEPGCIDALCAARGPGVGAIGPLLLGPAGLESAGLAYSERSGRLRQLREPPPARAEVQALSGCCLLLRTEERFDEAFRHGMEDVELSLRLRRRGLRLLIEPRARCLHLGGGTVNRRSREAARHALAGHLRLVGDSPLRRGFVVALALAQIAREGGPAERVVGVWEAVRG